MYTLLFFIAAKHDNDQFDEPSLPQLLPPQQPWQQLLPPPHHHGIMIARTDKVTKSIHIVNDIQATVSAAASGTCRDMTNTRH